MKKSFYINILSVLVFTFLFSSFMYSADPLANTKITLTCSNGKTYTATTDSRGKFTIADYDCDGTYTFSASSSVDSWSWGESQQGTFGKGNSHSAGKVNLQDISITKEASKTKGSAKRDAASGQATGKRQHSPVTVTHTLCSKNGKGKEDCDDKNSVSISITYDGSSIQGMAVNQKGTPGGSVKKGNK